MKKNLVLSIIAGLAILTSACKQGEVWALQSPIVAVPKNGQLEPQVVTAPQQAVRTLKGTVISSQKNPGGGFIVKVKIGDSLSPQYLNDTDLLAGTDVEVTTEVLASDPSKTRVVVRPIVSSTLPPVPTK